MWWGKSCGQSQSMASAEFHVLCVYLDFHLFLQIPWQSLHLGVTALGVLVGFGEGVVADPHSPSTDPHALFCFSAQDWDGSVVFLICKLRCEQENLSLFSPHKMRHIYLCTLLLEKLEKVFPRWDIGRFQFLNAGTCFPVCCTTPRSCFSLMLKNSGNPHKHTRVLSGNPGVKKQGEIGSPDLLGSSRANHQKSGSGSFTAAPEIAVAWLEMSGLPSRSCCFTPGLWTPCKDVLVGTTRI